MLPLPDIFSAISWNGEIAGSVDLTFKGGLTPRQMLVSGSRVITEWTLRFTEPSRQLLLKATLGSESLLPLRLFAFRPPDDSLVTLLPVSAGSACPTFANVTTLFVLNQEDAVVSLSWLLGQIVGILQCSKWNGASVRSSVILVFGSAVERAVRVLMTEVED